MHHIGITIIIIVVVVVIADAYAEVASIQRVAAHHSNDDEGRRRAPVVAHALDGVRGLTDAQLVFEAPRVLVRLVETRRVGESRVLVRVAFVAPVVVDGRQRIDGGHGEAHGE